MISQNFILFVSYASCCIVSISHPLMFGEVNARGHNKFELNNTHERDLQLSSYFSQFNWYAQKSDFQKGEKQCSGFR